jgi:hypothetical protein
LRAEGLGISQLQFLDQKKMQKYFQLYFIFLWVVIKTPDLDSLEMLDPNPDPQH